MKKNVHVFDSNQKNGLNLSFLSLDFEWRQHFNKINGAKSQVRHNIAFLSIAH